MDGKLFHDTSWSHYWKLVWKYCLNCSGECIIHDTVMLTYGLVSFGFFYVDQRTEQSINSSSRLFPLSQVSIDQSQVKFSTNAKKNYRNISLKIKTAKMLAHGAIWGLNCFVVSTMSSFFPIRTRFSKRDEKFTSIYSNLDSSWNIIARIIVWYSNAINLS